MIDYKNQRIGVFIDVQNMYYSARNLFNKKVNFGNIVKDVVGDRQLIRAIAYVVSTKTGENQPFFDALANIGIETKEKELMEYHGGQKKADWDVGITVDTIQMSEGLDVIVLVSGDGDYIPLVEYLKSRGKIVEVASFRETTSTRLVESLESDNYTNLSENKRKFLIGPRRLLGKKNHTELNSSNTQSGTVDTKKATQKSVTKTPTRNPKSRPTKPLTKATRKQTSKKPVGRKSLKQTKPSDDGLSANERALNN